MMNPGQSIPVHIRCSRSVKIRLERGPDESMHLGSRRRGKLLMAVTGQQGPPTEKIEMETP